MVVVKKGQHNKKKPGDAGGFNYIIPEVWVRLTTLLAASGRERRKILLNLGYV
jgi:hypothetical protein